MRLGFRRWTMTAAGALCLLAGIMVCPPVLGLVAAADGRIDNPVLVPVLWLASLILVVFGVLILVTRSKVGFWRETGERLWRHRLRLTAGLVLCCLGMIAGLWSYGVWRNRVDLFDRLNDEHPIVAELISHEPGTEAALERLVQHFARRDPIESVKPCYLWTQGPEACERRAQRILEGRLGSLYGAPDYVWRPGTAIEWGDLSRRLVHGLHRQFFLFDLLAYADGEEQQRIPFALALIKEWRRTNPVWPNFNLWAWNDETTAERIQAHMFLMERWRRCETVPVEEEVAFLKSLVQHADRLADPSEYTANTNHGVMQNNALLSVALHYPELDRGGAWRRTAVDRQQDYVYRMVTSRGVLREITPAYHYFVVRVLCWFLASCRKADIELSGEFEARLRKMLVFCREILSPDRSLPMIADTSEKKVPDLSNWPWEDLPDWPELAALRRALVGSGVAPNQPCARLWPDSGYFVLRAPSPAWTVDSAMMLTLRVGPMSAAHRHPDALSITFFANGRPLLTGPGSPDFFHMERRERLIGTPYQNTVCVDGKSQRLGDSRVRFCETVGGKAGDGAPEFVAVQGQSRLYDGVEHRRTLFYGPAVGAILVVDELVSDREHEYRQQFHLASGLAAELAAGTIAVSDPTRASDVPVLRIHGWTIEKGRVEPSRAVAAGQVATFHVDARRAVLVALLDSSGGRASKGLRVDSDAIEWRGRRGTLTVRLPIVSAESFLWHPVDREIQ